MMRKPLIISLAFHALVLLFAVATFPTFSDRLPTPPTPTPVDLVTAAEFTKVKAGNRKAKEEQAKAAKKPELPATKEAEKPTPKPKKLRVAKAPETEPTPEKVELAPKKLEVEKPKPENKVTKADPGSVPAPTRKPAKPVVKPEPKMAKKKPAPALKKKDKDFDPDRIAALLDKSPDAGPKAAPAVRPQKKSEPAKGRTDGRDLQMTFNEIDALRARISECWNPPVGGLGADAIQVKLRLQLMQDGSLTTAPQVVNRAGSPFFQAAADAAVRAVMQCQPYQLPPRKYALWRDMILNFDPREMFGG